MASFEVLLRLAFELLDNCIQDHGYAPSTGEQNPPSASPFRKREKICDRPIHRTFSPSRRSSVRHKDAKCAIRRSEKCTSLPSPFASHLRPLQPHCLPALARHLPRRGCNTIHAGPRLLSHTLTKPHAAAYLHDGAWKKLATISGNFCKRCRALSTVSFNSSFVFAVAFAIRVFRCAHASSSGLSSGAYGGRKNNSIASEFSSTNFLTIFAL